MLYIGSIVISQLASDVSPSRGPYPAVRYLICPALSMIMYL